MIELLEGLHRFRVWILVWVDGQCQLLELSLQRLLVDVAEVDLHHGVRVEQNFVDGLDLFKRAALVPVIELQVLLGLLLRQSIQLFLDDLLGADNLLNVLLVLLLRRLLLAAAHRSLPRLLKHHLLLFLVLLVHHFLLLLNNIPDFFLFLQLIILYT